MKDLITIFTYVEQENLVVTGAGKFGEDKLVLNKNNASILFVELFKFLEFKKEKPEFIMKDVEKWLKTKNMTIIDNNRFESLIYLEAEQSFRKKN